MIVSALLLSCLGLVLGLLPLVPSGSAAVVVLAAVGVLPAASGLLLALTHRSHALRHGLRLGWATGTLALSVAATLLCLVWLATLVVLWCAPRGSLPGKAKPSPQTVQRPTWANDRIAQSACALVPHLLVRAEFEYTGPTSSLG